MYVQLRLFSKAPNIFELYSFAVFVLSVRVGCRGECI